MIYEDMNGNIWTEEEIANMPGVLVVHPDLGVGVPKEGSAGGVDGPFAEGIVSEMIGGLNGSHEGFADMSAEVRTFTQQHTVTAMFGHNGFEFVCQAMG